MRVSQQEKTKSRSRIVQSAARLFRERGVERTSLGDVMKDAGLTHGGFYRHFPTKDALLEGALDAAFHEIVAPLKDGLADRSPTDVGQEFRQFYLSGEHLENAARGCPVAALAGEVARLSESTKKTFSTGIRLMSTTLAQTKKGEEAVREEAAVRELAMMVGALAIARACEADTADFVLSACRKD